MKRNPSILSFIVILLSLTKSQTLELETLKIHQKILVGPRDIVVNAGETVQFPCIVSKQSDAVVTWCWNDFCTLGKSQFLRHETTSEGLISVYQYTSYPRFQLFINEHLNHYNLSIKNVSTRDEGIFQCQIQRTPRAHEARSDRVHLILMDPPVGSPTLVLPPLPLKQGHSTNITCLSSPSKPASILILYKDEQILTTEASSMISFEFDTQSNKNGTMLVYTIVDPDSSWHNVLIRCEQLYTYVQNSSHIVSARLHTHYKPKARIESQNRHPLTVNSTATFRCIVHGNPEPQFKWFANSMDLTSVTSSVINIPLSKHVHNHTIGCSATNSIGTTNTTLRLLIRYPPIIFVRPPKFVVIDLDRKSSSPSIVRCIVDSFPRAKITWLHNGKLLAEGSTFYLRNITKAEEQGLYSYRIEAEGFETIIDDFIVHIKGKPLVYIQESKEDQRFFECQVYSAMPILRISWKLNDQMIISNDRSSISTVCNDFSCLSKLTYDYRKLTSSSNNLFRLSCVAENQFGIEQSRLYQIDTSEDVSMVLVSILMSIFLLIIFFSIVAIFCCCRTRQIRKRYTQAAKSQLPIVYDEHYSINELIKEVGSFRTCHVEGKTNDRIEPTDRLLTTLYNEHTKKLLDNLSNESSTNSSGFHSKSTTTIYNNEYSPPLSDPNFSGISSFYASHYQMNV